MTDPAIQELKAKAQQKPGDAEGWRAVVSAVLEKMNEDPAKAPELAFDLVRADLHRLRTYRDHTGGITS